MSTTYAHADNKPQPGGAVQPDAAVPKAASAEGRWALLRRGRFLALWTGQLAGLIGDSFNYVAVAWLVLQLTGSGRAARAAHLLGGAVNDRLSPRLTMVLAGLARASRSVRQMS